MKIYSDTNLTSFQFWAGAKDNANKLTYEELEYLDEIISDIYPDGIDETKINDWFWFDFEDVCDLIGLKYDVDEDIVIRP